MNYRVDPSDNFSNLNWGRGTSDGESCNKIINKLCADLVRMTAELSDKKVWLRATQFNLNLDRKLSMVLQIDSPLSIDWWLHEALVQKSNVFSHYNKMQFPNELPNGYNEPHIGIQYGRCREIEDI